MVQGFPWPLNLQKHEQAFDKHDFKLHGKWVRVVRWEEPARRVSKTPYRVLFQSGGEDDYLSIRANCDDLLDVYATLCALEQGLLP